MYRSLLRLWRTIGLAKSTQLKVLRVMNHTFLVGVTGVIFNANREVLLVKHSYRRVPWSLPGGYLQSGEHPKEGLQREIFEETNFTVRIEKIIKTQHDADSPRIDMCYVGTYLRGTFKKSHEVIEYDFFSTKKLPPLIDDQHEQISLALNRYNQLHTRSLYYRLKTLLPNFKKRTSS